MKGEQVLLEVLGVSHQFGGVQVLHSVNFEVYEGEIVCIVGSSGCGKTTLLKIISGLIERPSSGSVRFNGQLLDGIPPGKRDIGILVQGNVQYSQFSIRRDIGIAGEYAGLPPEEVLKRVQSLAQSAGIAHLLNRKGAAALAISGGEARRVSLARALVLCQKLLLLDEPLKDLDKVIQGKLRNFMRETFRAQGTTVVWVTHDLTEAFSVADRVIVMDRGGVEQIGTPQEILEHPATPVVQGFVDLFRSEHNAVAHLLR